MSHSEAKRVVVVRPAVLESPRGRASRSVVRSLRARAPTAAVVVEAYVVYKGMKPKGSLEEGRIRVCTLVDGADKPGEHKVEVGRMLA